MSLGRGLEEIISHFPFPKLTLSVSLSCPAIEGDDHTMPHLKWTVYELIGLINLNVLNLYGIVLPQHNETGFFLLFDF